MGFLFLDEFLLYSPSPLMGEGDLMKSTLKPFAKHLRKRLTDTEQLLWKQLRPLTPSRQGRGGIKI